MSSETDHPRQRTVAELLAAHGETAGTGRRRRRRESDEPVDATSGTGAWSAAPTRAEGWDHPPLADGWRAEPPLLPSREVLRQPVPRDPEPGAGHAVRSQVGAPPVLPATLTPRSPGDRDLPTEQLPRYGDAGLDRTGPIAPAPLAPADPPATTWPPVEPPPRRPDDAGPPTQSAPMDFDDVEPSAPAAGRHPGGVDLDEGPDLRVAGPDDTRFDDVAVDDAGIDDTGIDDAELGAAELDDPALDEQATEGGEPARTRGGRRRGAAPAAPGPSWFTVVMQWVLGAVGGALLWVSFSYLWQNVTVVAIAAAVVVTVGLVLLVRGLLNGNDRRTTALAVLVGLLLTASPGVLWFLQR